ncbi:hypothetical protein PVAND_015254 [Polypedilum vanderplanki]|uniref:Ankyrin repeat protein n=1 Tax=Polypedilum vanderplanki TaxID=319348 RepID=A0A9J6BCJ1_POLVA|nr:hypothetical protein PVAND_015254 [Polypedilum vanderplanki]
MNQPIVKFDNKNKQFLIEKCASVKDGLSFISIDQNFKNDFEKENDVNTIILTVEEKLDKIQEIESLEFETKPWLVIVFFSSINDRQMIINWRNRDSKDFFHLNFEENFSKNVLSMVFDCFIKMLESGGSFEFPPIKGTANIFVTILKDSRGNNLLMKSIEEQNEKIFDELLELPFDLHYTSSDDDANWTAADIAYKNKKFSILLKLLKKNSPFPNDFEENEDMEEITKFIDDLEILHEGIKKNDSEKVKQILDNYPHLIYFYNISNKSALAVAAEFCNLEIYKLLIKKGCSIGKFENYEKVLASLHLNGSFNSFGNRKTFDEVVLDDSQTTVVQEIISEKIPITEPYLAYHYKNSEIICNRKRPIQDKRILLAEKNNFFDIINESEDGKLILKITACSNNVFTYIDFENDSVYYITGEKYPNHKHCIGLFQYKYPEIFKISAGAKNFGTSDNEIAATIKHEHCHMAMLMVFGNKCKPYGIYDVEHYVKFTFAEKECQSKINVDKIVDRVFQMYFDEQQNSYNYEPKFWHAELAVRVPEMITCYRDKKEILENRREEFSYLFDYYENFVMKEMEESLPLQKILFDGSNSVKFYDLTRPLQSIILFSIQGEKEEIRLKIAENLSSLETMEILGTEIIFKAIKAQSNASFEIIYKYECGNKYYRYNYDKEPADYGVSGGLYAPGKEVYLGLNVWEKQALAAGSIQLDPPGFIKSFINAPANFVNNSKEVWFLVNDKNHNYEWVPSQNGRKEPFVIDYGGIASAYFGRIIKNGRVFIGNVVEDTGVMYYVDENGFRQRITSGYEVLTCKSSKNDTKFLPPKFETIPNVDIGCINNWQPYKNDDAPAKNGISAGEYDCNNTAYVGKANPSMTYSPGRLQIIDPKGVYVTESRKEILITDNSSYYLADNLNYSYYWVNFQEKLPENAVFVRSDGPIAIAIARVSLNGHMTIGYTIQPLALFPTNDGQSDEYVSDFEVLVCDPWPKYQCSQNWVNFNISNAKAVKKDGFNIGTINNSISVFIGRSCDFDIGIIQVSPQSAAGIYYANEITGTKEFDNSSNVEYLVKNPSDTYKWQPSRNGVKVVNALELHKEGHRPFYIGMTRINDNVVVGKVRPGDGLFFIDPLTGKQQSTSSYEVLTCTSPDAENGEYEEESDEQWYGDYWCPSGKKWSYKNKKCI